MSKVRRRRGASAVEVVGDPPGWLRRSVSVSVDPVLLPGELVIPERMRGIVVFAHGSGSSRRSPRNVAVWRIG